MSSPPERPPEQPEPALGTRPMRVQKRIGAWVWVVIAVVFVVLVAVILAMGAGLW